ncbi:hypothetical protein GU926_09295 [Nibribacter ruber]|uniref:Uncharacterized protein n=1 Tax=Nibribacter ruber TaxID=2698458 RepID=A0A6P1P1Q0_9BACT|nr:hypothetical protein [Nibribacter ruber]QHL87622.1 hypothetical protein GU926_09295 [Nibribacter ruber]
MKPKYLLLLLLLIPVDFLSYTQIGALLRQPSNTAVLFGVFFLVILLAGNFIILRFLLSNIKRS